MQFVYPLMLFLLFVIDIPLLCYFNNFKVDTLSLDFNVAVHKLAGFGHYLIGYKNCIVCYTLWKMCFFIIIVRRYFLEDFKEIEKWIYGLVNFTHQMLSTACV